MDGGASVTNSFEVASRVDMAVALVRALIDACVDRETLRKKFIEKFGGDINAARTYFSLALRRLAKAGEVAIIKFNRNEVICRSEKPTKVEPSGVSNVDWGVVASFIQYGILKAFTELLRSNSGAVSLALLGTKRVKKPSGKVYEYVYVRLNTEMWPEVADAHKVRLRIAPPDLSAPPVVVLARRFQGSAHSVAFDVPREYQKLVREYARNSVVAVLGVEVVEKYAEKP